MKDKVIMIPLERIRIVNPRCRNRMIFEKIVESIREHGLKNPIQVSPRVTANGEGDAEYDLVCGQGRIEAFQSLGYQEIPAVVVEASKEDRMIMSLVENMARRNSTPADLMAEIERLQAAGHSKHAIGRKLGLNWDVVNGLLSLNKAGEERLYIAAINETIPLGVAIDIAKTGSAEEQRALLKAYQSGKLNQAGIRTVRRVMDQRNSFGKTNGNPGGRKPRTTADTLVSTFKREGQRQKLLIRKAKVCEAQLIIVVTAFRRLGADEDFTNLLRAEKLDTMPSFLAERIESERNPP